MIDINTRKQSTQKIRQAKMSEVGPEEFAKKKKVKKVCAVDFSDNTVLEMLEKYYGCDVTCSKYGTEFCDDKDMVFLFEDFDNEAFNNFISVSPASSVLGAAIVKIRRRHELPDATTSLLITTQAKGKAFRQFVALGQSVVLPSWLLECWEHRNDEAFTPLSENMITKHRIGVFENLRVFVHGFSQAEEEDIKKHIADNRGFIVDSSSKATHCVVNALRDLDNLGFSPGQRFVTNEWVWTSINIQYCANEDTYSVERSKAGQSLSDHIHDKSSFSITDRVSSEGNIAKTAKLSRSHQVCIEIYETDVSYVNALKLLLEVKHGLEQAAESGCPLMQKSEIALIFGKISPIIKVHEAIISRLKQILDNWKSDVEVAQTWIDAHDDLNRVYVPYSNTYDTAGEKLNWADRTNPRLHAFIRAKECKSNFKRNTLQDLLIRPVQRMPTLIVLLKADSVRIDDATVVGDEEEVGRANEVRAQNDNFIEQLNFFNEVEDVPICKVRVLPNSGTVGRLDRRTSFSNMMTSKKQ
ncbi:RhoGEF domain protein [Teladorsagia circumcincta]|uniref:RhoGEF domain protein n=1 Tax=Teladorsagia circumcincta TaxID=45464 RepID=A0A2G9URK6_TELCI|nr:RhoGEF domain protein [Teladorsagia circumcincta]